MPRYDYACEGCGRVFELNHSFATRITQHPCEGCGSVQPVHRLFSMPAVQYRTDGFYGYDNADSVTKYQREYFSESGDRSDKKLSVRRKRRGS